MLGRLMGDEAIVRVISNAFLDDIPRQVRALKRVLAADDVQGTERLAHTIKGATANVGGERLREVASQMEQAARAGDLATAGSRMAELEARFEQLKDTMAGSGSR